MYGGAGPAAMPAVARKRRPRMIGRMTPVSAPAEDPKAVLHRIAAIAALGVALGFGIQILVVAAKLLLGGYVARPLLPLDLASGVAWSVVVCLATGIGVSVLRAAPTVSGLIAALFAPLAVAASKAANQMMSAAIGVIGREAAVSLVTLAGLKALEYGLLGFLLARLARSGETRFARFAGTGLGVGIVFAGVALWIRLAAGTAPAAEIAATAINEVIFPAGCAAVVYVGRMMARAGSG